MAGIIDSFKQVYARDRKAWRKWLEKNHDKSPGIWLIYYKKTSGKPRVDYADAVEEALCFGWIDSTSRTLDEERYVQLFMPRKAKSNWSKLNKERIVKMEKAGLMTPAGRAKIEAAKKDGSWEKMDHVEEVRLPEELEKAFGRNKTARKNFEGMSKTAQKEFLYWLHNIKTQELRKQRVKDIVSLCKENKRLYRIENGKQVRNI